MTPQLQCDTHMHFYDDRYPSAPTALLHPPNALAEDYRSLQESLGIGRFVVVQPTTYGLDNACQLEAMAGFGDTVRGVMVVNAETSTAELRRLADLGVVGARLHMLPGGVVGWDELEAVAQSLVDVDWHVQLQLNGRELADRLDQLRRLPVDLVIDHVGRFMPPVDVGDESFQALRQLIDEGRTWVKLSAPYESSVAGPPRYDDVEVLVAELLAAAPERMLWATNWPHPGQSNPPSAADLHALRDRWLPSAALRSQILIANPASLYGFP